ncbi:MAG TPA: hypothetical protein VIT67_09445, partial [Povalibacter sp.]
LNGNIRSRLTQVRHQALEEADASRSRRRFWIPAAGLTAAALMATIVVMPYIKKERSGLPESFAAADDMAMLLNSDELELIEDMDFYAWMDGETDSTDDTPPADSRS